MRFPGGRARLGALLALALAVGIPLASLLTPSTALPLPNLIHRPGTLEHTSLHNHTVHPSPSHTLHTPQPSPSPPQCCVEYYGALPCSNSQAGNFVLMIVYGGVLLFAAKLIADGSELLLEVLDPGVVGGLVLPVLGALPDAFIIGVSGMAGSLQEAQEEVVVGMGTLAGSTVMLLTITWGVSLLVGRCDLSPPPNVRAIDGTRSNPWDLWNTGATTDRTTPHNAWIMLASILPMLIVQAPTFWGTPEYSRTASLVGLVVSVLMLCSYCVYQVLVPELQLQRMLAAREKFVSSYSIRSMHHLAVERGSAALVTLDGTPDETALRTIFTEFDANGDGMIDRHEIKMLVCALTFGANGFIPRDCDVEFYLRHFDTDRSSTISQDEFVHGMQRWMNDVEYHKYLVQKQHESPLLPNHKGPKGLGLLDRSPSLQEGDISIFLARTAGEALDPGPLPRPSNGQANPNHASPLKSNLGNPPGGANHAASRDSSAPSSGASQGGSDGTSSKSSSTNSSSSGDRDQLGGAGGNPNTSTGTPGAPGDNPPTLDLAVGESGTTWSALQPSPEATQRGRLNKAYGSMPTSRNTPAVEAIAKSTSVMLPSPSHLTRVPSGMEILEDDEEGGALGQPLLPPSADPEKGNADASAGSRRGSGRSGEGEGEGEGEAEGEGEEAGPSASLPSKGQTVLQAVAILALGSVGLALFSGPLVDTVNSFARLSQVPAFFISFVATPLASNASELYSSLLFAAGMKRKNITLTFSQVYGAVTMNNTLCLGVFLALVFFRGIVWDFSAEVTVLLIVIVLVGALGSSRTTFPSWMAIPVLSLYPLSLSLVAFLDYYLLWH